MRFQLFIISLTHAFIDATCAAVVFSLYKVNLLSSDSILVLFILYGLLAFGLEIPFGMLADKWKNPRSFSIAGCLIVAIAPIIVKSSPLLAIYLAGIGNAFFHIGAGIISLNMRPGKASMPGVFVAPGVLGLLAGTFVGRDLNFVGWPFVILLVISAISIYFIKNIDLHYDFKKVNTFSYWQIAILFLLISVVVRSLVGMAIVFPWKSNITLLIILTISVFLGKALGGIFADKFGWLRVSLVSLLLAAFLIFFGVEYPVLGISGIFLFNITMPVTLTAISNLLPGQYGLAFGLTTMALLLGSAPVLTGYAYIFSGRIIILLLVLISAIVISFGLKMYSCQENNSQELC